jgi:hypothetical protein
MKDIISEILPVHTIVPIVANNTAEGTGVAIDLAGYEGAALLACLGDSADTLSGSLYWTIAFQHSDTTTAGDFVNIPAADLLGGLNDVVIDAPAEDQIIVARGYKGGKRYVRILCTQTGTHTNGTPLAGVVIKGAPRHAPQAQAI